MKRQLQILLMLMLMLMLCSGAVFLQAPAAQKSHGTKTAQRGRAIDDTALRNADSRTGDWITHGRNYSETRFSPLKSIDASNVKDLRLAWSFDTDTTRGLEATPLIVDGVMYTTGSWSIVYALD